MTASWLLIDVSHVGEVRLATASPDRPFIESVTRFTSEGLPTFTDALLRFERETRQRLYGMIPVIAIAGAPVGDSIPIVRTRWNVSRAGVTSMTGQMAIVLNDNAAQAWALIGAMPAMEAVRGTGAPDLRMRGRYLFIAINDGVGLATIDIDDHGHVTVIDSEGGHADFQPHNDAEAALVRAVTPVDGIATWEQILLSRRLAEPGSVIAAGEQRAGLLGRFVANTILTTGAWNGAILSGVGLPRFDAAARRAFDTSLNERRAFQRLFSAARCWRVDQREPVLSGAAALMAQRHRNGTGA